MRAYVWYMQSRHLLAVSPSILDIAPHVLRLPFVLAPLPRPTVLRYMVLRYIFVLRLILFSQKVQILPK